MATDDLKARVRAAAEFQYSPASAEQTLEAACGIIATLEAQLAARDAEIAAMKAGKDGFCVTLGVPYTFIPNRKDEA